MSRPLLLHSVSYSGSWGQAHLTLDAFIDKAADLGFDGVMLMAKRPHLSPLDIDAAGRARLRDHILNRSLKSVTIAGYTNFTADAGHGEVPHREIQIVYVNELARLASDLGGTLVRIFTGYEDPRLGYTAQWNAVVSAIRECSQRAAEHGVTIGVQNHHDVACGWESLKDLIEAIGEPNCRAMFDAWAPALQDVPDLRAAARSLAPLMAQTTVADYAKRPRYRYNPEAVNYEPRTAYAQAVPMGEGFIDYAAFFDGLKAGGFTGGAAYEMCSPLLGGGSEENLDRYARHFIAYMREHE